MNSPHWIDKHFTSPEERAAKLLADAQQAAREGRGRVWRLLLVRIPLVLAVVALLGCSTGATLNYYGVIDLTAYAPQLPRKAPAVAVASPGPEAAQPAGQDVSALILAPYDAGRPVAAPVQSEPVVEPEPAQPARDAGQPISAAHAEHLRQGIAMMGRELAENDTGIAQCKAALYVRPWQVRGGRPPPWTDAEHLVELEAYWNRSRLTAAQVWDYNRAHDIWAANVRNDRKRLADLTAKHDSIAARQDKAKAELDQ